MFAPLPNISGHRSLVNLHIGPRSTIGRRIEALESYVNDKSTTRHLCSYVQNSQQHKLLPRLLQFQPYKGFYADCRPNEFPSFGGMFHRDHFVYFSDFDFKVLKSVEFVLKTYNDTEGEELVFLKILNVTAESGGKMALFVTFECLNPSPKGNENYVNVYQTVVTCPAWRLRGPGDHVIRIFRRMERGGKGIDLLPADSYYKELTRVKTELMTTKTVSA